MLIPLLGISHFLLFFSPEDISALGVLCSNIESKNASGWWSSCSFISHSEQLCHVQLCLLIFAYPNCTQEVASSSSPEFLLTFRWTPSNKLLAVFYIFWSRPHFSINSFSQLILDSSQWHGCPPHITVMVKEIQGISKTLSLRFTTWCCNYLEWRVNYHDSDFTKSVCWSIIYCKL